MRILEYIQAHASVEDESGNIHNANIIWGTSEKPQLGNAIELVVVATGFEGDEEKRMMKTVIPPARIVKPVPEGGDPAGKPVLEPVGKPGKATPQTRPLEQVILGEKSTVTAISTRSSPNRLISRVRRSSSSRCLRAARRCLRRRRVLRSVRRKTAPSRCSINIKRIGFGR